MKLLRFLFRLLRLPLDLCFLSWDFFRSLKEAILRLMHHPAHCSFCEEIQVGNGRLCRAANRYGNLWLFKQVCPCVEAADSAHDRPWCGLDNSYERKLGHLPLIGCAVLFLWGGVAYAIWTCYPHAADHVPDLAEGSASPGPEKSQNKKTHFERGLAFLEAEAYPDARISLLNARNSDPENGEIYHALGRLYMQIGEMENAFMSMKLAVQNLPDDMDARRRLAEVYLFRLDYEKALGLLNVICERRPEDLVAILFRVYTLREMGRLQEADQEQDRLLAASESHGPMKIRVADLVRGQGDLDRAETLYREALNEGKAQAGLIRVYIARGDFDAATRLLLKMPEGAEKERRALRAELLVKQERFDAAIAEYEQLLHDDPREEHLKLKLALLLNRIGRSDAAAARAEELLYARDPKNVLGGHGLLARIYLAKKLFRQSIEHANAILRLQKNNPTGLYVKAQALAGQGNQGQALDLLAALEEARPGHFAGGLLMAALQKPAEAEQTYARLARAHPDSAVPLTFLAVLQFERQDFSACVETATKALLLQPEAALAANRLILSLIEAERLDEAHRIATPFYKRFPKIPYILDAYGWVQFKRGEVEEAAELLRAAVQGNSSPLVLYHAGAVLIARGQEVEGRKHLALALELGPNFPGADIARRLLAPNN